MAENTGLRRSCSTRPNSILARASSLPPELIQLLLSIITSIPCLLLKLNTFSPYRPCFLILYSRRNRALPSSPRFTVFALGHRSILPPSFSRMLADIHRVGRSSTIGSTIDASRLVANPTAFRPDPSDLVRSVRVPWQRY